MPFDAKAVANQFLELASERGETLDPMKLQKLAFFAHGWHLVVAGGPLINGGVQAWEFGPVVAALDTEFEDFGVGPITRKATDVRSVDGPEGPRLEPFEPSIDADPGPSDKALAKALIGRVYEVYARFSGMQLSDMTHLKGSPWSTVRKAFPEGVRRGLTIPDETIQAYFLELKAHPGSKDDDFVELTPSRPQAAVSRSPGVTNPSG